MYLKFLRLEIKNFLRSKSLGANIGMKLLMAFLSIYVVGLLLLFGFGGYELAKQELHVDPLRFLSGFMIYVLVYGLVLTFVMQQLSTQNIKPFLSMNVPKAKIVKYTLLKSLISVLTWGYAFFYVPFLIRSALDKDYNYSVLHLLGFLVSVIALYFFNNFLNFLLTGKEKLVYAVAVIFAAVGALDYYEIFPLREYSEKIFMGIVHQPWYAIFPILMMLVAARAAYQMVLKSFYLDEGLATKKTVGKTQDIAFLSKYGVIGTFINNDIRLLRRSKMGKGVLVSAVLFLFYGLIFYMSKVYQTPTMMIFLGLFTTGGFQFMFGQRIPSFDSSYYPLMMTLNVPYKEYLNAKWWLMNLVTALSLVLATFYIYFGWELYLSMVAGALYNIGVNSQMVLLGGAYNKSPVDLSSKSKMFAQKNNFNLKTVLLLIPQMIVPMVIFGVMQAVVGIGAAILAIAILGIIGFLLKDKIFNYIVKLYKREKYSTLVAFKEV